MRYAMHHHRIALHDVCGLGDHLGESSCGVLTDTSTDGLKAYAQECGEEKALQQLTAQGIDVSKIKRLANGEIDWRDGASAVASYELGTNVDVREMVDDDNNIRWDKVAETAGSVAAAAVCTAYGAGAAAPVCGFVGGKLGGAIYKVGSEFVDAVGDVFGSKTPPILVPSPDQTVNLVAQFYLEHLPGYLQGLAAMRGVAMIAASTARMLNNMLFAATGESMDLNDMIRRMQHAGMALPAGWISTLRMPNNQNGFFNARDSGGVMQVATTELALIHYAFGMNYNPAFDSDPMDGNNLKFHGHDIDGHEDDHETQMFWIVATQGAPYVRFVSTSADDPTDAPWPPGDLSWKPGDAAPSHCALSTQGGGSGPTPPAADKYGHPIVFYDCFADGGMGGFPKGAYGTEVDVSYNDALRRLLVKPADQQAQLRVAWFDSIRKAADVIRADIRIAKANKKLFVVNPSIFGNIFGQQKAPEPTWKKALKYGAGAAVVAGSAWTAMRLFEKKPVVPPSVAAAVKKRVPW